MAFLNTITSLGQRNSWVDDTIEREDLISSEKQEVSLEARYQALEASCRRLRRSLVVVTLLFGCVAAVLLFPWKADPIMPGSSALAHHLPVESVTFERNAQFSPSSGPESDSAWLSLMPPGDGFVVVDKPRQYHLPQGKSTRYGEVYDVSLFHQLHCLAHIRQYLYTMQASLNQTHPFGTFEVLLAPQEDHVEHCFDYLRQALMCAGDMTLEWPRTEADGRRFAVDGWGVQHQCKRWDAIMDLMKKHTVARNH